jgi:hypothetical protein
MKSVIVDINTRNIEIVLDGKNVLLDDISLNGMKMNTVVDARVIFNTLKHCKICCGKPVASKHNVTKYSLVQEWCVPCDENIQLRLTARNCKVAAAFTSISNVCNICQNQEFGKIINIQPPNDDLDPEKMFESLFYSQEPMNLLSNFLKHKVKYVKVFLLMKTQKVVGGTKT